MNPGLLPDRVTAIAAQLADHQHVTSQGHRHSLADGAAGISVFYSALSTIDPQWAAIARGWLAHALEQPVHVDGRHGLFHGAPALAYALCIAAAHDSDYLTHVNALHQPVSDIIDAKLTAAHERLAAGRWCGYREYDLVNGLSGLAGLLLLASPQSPLLRDVVSYLVTLTAPIVQGGQSWPGWWVHHSPNPAKDTVPGGHGNFGIAHGITGPLAILALTWRHGIKVSGHRAAMETITDWLSAWQQGQPEAPWWPPFITNTHQQNQYLDASIQQQPASWCYGSPGIAMALHHTAQALGSAGLRDTAVAAILTSLTSNTPRRLAQPGLCHGTAGLTVTTRRMASYTRGRTGHHLESLAAEIAPPSAAGNDVGLLTGSAGIGLAHLTNSAASPPVAWDRFLLLE